MTAILYFLFLLCTNQIKNNASHLTRMTLCDMMSVNIYENIQSS